MWQTTLPEEARVNYLYPCEVFHSNQHFGVKGPHGHEMFRGFAGLSLLVSQIPNKAAFVFTLDTITGIKHMKTTPIKHCCPTRHLTNQLGGDVRIIPKTSPHLLPHAH